MWSNYSMSKKTVCWISSARYNDPLETTTSKKWRMMAELHDYDIRITGFSTSLRPHYFNEHVHFYLIPQPPTSILRYLTIFALSPLLLLYLVFRYDGKILVAQSPFEGAIGAFVKGVSRLFGKKLWLIIENHNNFEEDVFLQRDIPLMGVYRKVMLALARLAFRHGDAVRVISSSTIERATHYAPDLPQVRFMTWSDTDIFQNTQRTIPVEDAQDMVYAGVLIPRKGVHHLLTAFSKLEHSTAQLHLVGHPENEAYAEQLQQQAQELGIADRVQFVGNVSQQGLADYFAKSRVMVLPSLSEGLGRVVVEAMLLGIPVIGCRVGGIPDMITDGENGYLVEPDDVNSLAEALQKIYSDDVKTMGSTAQNFAQDFFSPEQYVAGYQQLFEMAD
jgi:glycosyltransferase involved in cell wall biosynthesis